MNTTNDNKELDEKKAAFQRHLSLYEAFKEKPLKMKILTENIYGHLNFKPILNKEKKNSRINNTTFQQRQNDHTHKVRQKEIKYVKF